MKDHQMEKGKGVPGISPVCHYVAMSVIVLFRRNLGLEFLKPRWVFLLTAWVYGFFFAFAVLSYRENSILVRNWPFLVFVLVALVAYIAHFSRTVTEEFRRRAVHDYYSGDSHFLPLTRLFEIRQRDLKILVTHLLIEPALLLVLAVVCLIFDLSLLGKWLFLTAIALFTKELINHWKDLRKLKKLKDSMDDVGDMDDHDAFSASGGEISGRSPSPGPGKGRSGPEELPRRRPNSSSRQADLKHAAILGMQPPFSLEKAEACYRAAVKRVHPDPGRYAEDAEDLPDEEKLQEVLDAYRHFKQKYSA